MSPDYVPSFEHCLLPYVQWYQEDFVGGVRGMRAHEIGIYTMLLMEMYARGHALDMPIDRLARLCGSDKRTFEKTLELLLEEGKIIRLNCGLWNDRCENAFRSRAKMQEQNSNAAIESWKKRRKNNGRDKQTQSNRKARAMPSSEAQNTDISVVLPNGRTTLPEAASSAASSAPPMSAEDQFWDMLPEWEKTTGVDRSRLLQIKKFRQCSFEELMQIAQAATKARNASSYIGRIVTEARKENAPPPPADPSVPTWVTSARADGYPVEREGRHWRFAGGIFDDQKQLVGN